MKRSEKNEGEKQVKKAIVSGLIAVFVMSLVVGLLPYDLVQPVSAASTKKAPIHINNTAGGALSYYQVNLNITYDSDMNNNFSDVRVKNETTGTFVPYWIEDKVDGSWCNLWFNATSIPASVWCNDTYYLYYGDTSASSESNGTNTFEFFDDFSHTGLQNILIREWESENTSDLYHVLSADIDNDETNEAIGIGSGKYYAFELSDGSTTRNVTVGNPSWEIRGAKKGDIDNDGDIEIAFIENDGSSARLVVIDHNGNELWNKSFSISVNTEASYVAIGNLTGTADLEIVNATNNDMCVWDKDGNLEWQNTSLSLGGGAETYSNQIIADYDGDGQNEIFVGGYQTHNIYILNGEDGSEVWAGTVSGDADDAAPIDINGDGAEDIVVVESARIGTPKIETFYGNNGTLAWSHSFADHLNAVDIYTNSDSGEKEIAGAGAPNTKVTVYYKNGTKKWDTTTEESRWKPDIATGNITGDGMPETVFFSYGTGGDYSTPKVFAFYANGTLAAKNESMEACPWSCDIIDGRIIMTTGRGDTTPKRMVSYIFCTLEGTCTLDTNTWNVTSDSWNTDDCYLKSTNDGAKVSTYANVIPSGGKEWKIKFKNHGAGEYNDQHRVAVVSDVTGTEGGDESLIFLLKTDSSPGKIEFTERISGGWNVLHTNTKYNYYTEAGTWYWVKVIKDGNSGKLKIWKEGVSEPSAWDWEGTYTAGLIDSGKFLDWARYTAGDGTGLDDIYIRKYASPEPTASFGAEQTADGGAYEITLLTGWNIIGYTNSTATDAQGIETDIGTNCTYSTSKNMTSGLYEMHEHGFGLNNFNVERGWGYFVYITDQTVWNRTS